MRVDPERKTPTWVEVIEAAVRKQLLQVFTIMPGKVVSYDFDSDRATVQPLLKRIYRADQAAVNLPLVTEVPVCFGSLGKSKIRFPVNIGDEGELHFQMRSIDLWLTKGGLVDPEDNRRHSIADATFWPGLRSEGQVVKSRGRKNALEILNDKMMIEMLPSGKITIKDLSSGNEFLDLVSQILDGLLTESFIFNKATFASIKSKLDKMKG